MIRKLPFIDMLMSGTRYIDQYTLTVEFKLHLTELEVKE